MECLQETKFRRYIACIGANCTIYILDINSMCLVKAYITGNKKYKIHYYFSTFHVIWIVDEDNKVFLLPLDDIKDIKKVKKRNKERLDIKKYCNPIPSLICPKECEKIKGIRLFNGSNAIIIYKNYLHIVTGVDKQFKQEIKGFTKKLEVNITIGEVINNLAIFISNEFKAYIVFETNLLNQENNKIMPDRVITLKGLLTTENHFFALFEKELIVLSKYKQKFYNYDLS